VVPSHARIDHIGGILACHGFSWLAQMDATTKMSSVPQSASTSGAQLAHALSVSHCLLIDLAVD
jgi:hypothetical protein